MRSLKRDFWLDALIFAGIMTVLQPRFTGTTIHEWLGFAAAATLILHVALHWDWVVGITRTFFKNLLHASRLNYLVNSLLFLAFAVVITSGLAISKVVMPTLGLQLLSGGSWREIHSTSANLTLLLVALHFALHWSWVKNTFSRLVLSPFKRGAPQPQPRPLPLPANRIKAL